MESVHTPKFDICYLRGLGHHILNMVFVALYVQRFPINMNFLYDIQTQNTLNTYYCKFLVGPCWRMEIHLEGAQLWQRSLKLQNFPKDQKIMVSWLWADLSRYIAPLLNKDNIFSFGDDWPFQVVIERVNPLAHKIILWIKANPTKCRGNMVGLGLYVPTSYSHLLKYGPTY